MLIKILRQEKGSRKLLAEIEFRHFHTKRFFQTVFIVLETAFSVLVLKDKKNITTEERQFIEILHTVPK